MGYVHLEHNYRYRVSFPSCTYFINGKSCGRVGKLPQEGGRESVVQREESLRPDNADRPLDNANLLRALLAAGRL